MTNKPRIQYTSFKRYNKNYLNVVNIINDFKISLKIIIVFCVTLIFGIFRSRKKNETLIYTCMKQK